jgi:thymidylate synthase (FAD)
MLLKNENCNVELIDHMGTDLTVVNAARVSFSNESGWVTDTEAIERFVGQKPPASEFRMLSDKDKRLVQYLANHNHWTPFAHAAITLRISAPIAIRTQFFKHKVGFTENEISRRYVKDAPRCYHPIWREAPDASMKQGSNGFLEYDRESDAMCIDGEYHFAITECKRVYENLIKQGVAPEQARMVLPQSTITEWYWTGSLAAYARFYKQRSDPHAQWEIREYAEAIYNIIQPLFPVSWVALTKEPMYDFMG